MFKHFLITPFNLKKSDWKINKKNKAILTQEWHRNRFKLFTDYCFPSVVSQTNKNFDWIVFFDMTTSEEFRKIVTELDNKFENFKPFYINGMDLFLPSIKEYIKSFNEEFIITTGIDNDDCISKNFINEIQNKFDRQEFMALDFIDGYTIQTQSEIKIGKKLHQYNPFISIFERNTNPKTVRDRSHRNWKSEKNITQIRGTKIWASIIHHENKVNEFTGYGKVNINEFFKTFKINKKQQLYIESNNIILSHWKMESFINNLSSYWKYRFKNLKKTLGFYG